MTTLINFYQPPLGPFVFQAVLDGETYTGTVPWQAFGQRYYLTLRRSDNSRVFTLPLIGSMEAVSVQSATWANGTTILGLALPHGFPIGATIELVATNFTPAAYNGKKRMLVASRSTLSYQIANDPGEVTGLGRISHDVDIAAGYFNESTLVFRQTLQQFEINP